VSDERLEELGPIDYVVLEWPGELPSTGEVQPLLLDLVDRGIVRILDIAFVAKDQDGAVSGLELGDLRQAATALRRSGGQLVASGRIPVQAILAALDAVEASD
jgi:hypothetical protein